MNRYGYGFLDQRPETAPIAAGSLIPHRNVVLPGAAQRAGGSIARVDALALRELLAAQDGVVSRAQVIDAGFDDGYIEAMIRRRKWARVHRGVYVAHTGPPTWRQRAWAAVLYYWPAVLCHDSAVRGEASESAVIHVAIEHPRRPATLLAGVKVHLAPPSAWGGLVESRPTPDAGGGGGSATVRGGRDPVRCAGRGDRRVPGSAHHPGSLDGCAERSCTNQAWPGGCAGCSAMSATGRCACSNMPT